MNEITNLQKKPVRLKETDKTTKKTKGVPSECKGVRGGLVKRQSVAETWNSVTSAKSSKTFARPKRKQVENQVAVVQLGRVSCNI